MKKVLSYGALSKEYSILKKNVTKLENMCDWLLKETKVQNKVIDQLKHLDNSKSEVLPRFPDNSLFCDQGHYGCKILHRRFNLDKIPIKNIPTSKEVHLSGSSDCKPKPNLITEMMKAADIAAVPSNKKILAMVERKMKGFRSKDYQKLWIHFKPNTDCQHLREIR